MKIWIVVCLVVLTACGQKSKPSPSVSSTLTTIREDVMADVTCPDESNIAALNKLNPILSGVINAPSEDALNDLQYSIDCYREWAKSLKDPCQRKGINSWLNWYENRLESRRSELQNPVKSDREEREQKDREGEARLAAWTKQHPFPKMPQCNPKEPK